MPFLLVTAIVIPITAGFLIAGPALGMALGMATGVAITVIAVRQRPSGPIETAAPDDERRHVLVVIDHQVNDPRTIERLLDALADPAAAAPPEVLVIAPARSRALDRWTSDVAPARTAAQENLVITLASLGKADVTASGRVVDEDIVQAVEDQLRVFPATEVVLVSEGADGRAGDELERRLEQPLRRLALGPAA